MLFFRKKEENVKAKAKSSCCLSDITEEDMKKAEDSKDSKGIKILGSGCAKCNALEGSVREALKEMGSDEDIEHVTDFAAIAS